MFKVLGEQAEHSFIVVFSGQVTSTPSGAIFQPAHFHLAIFLIICHLLSRSTVHILLPILILWISEEAE
jgi:hypothetical protein